MQVGGIEVYRNSPDDPVRYNKDAYVILNDLPQLDDSSILRVLGPQEESSDPEHWLDEIPDRLKGAGYTG